MLWDIEARVSMLEEWSDVRQVLTLSLPSPELLGGPDLSPDLARIGAGFTLLAGREAPPAEVSRLEHAAAQRGVPLKVLAPADAKFSALYQARFALVRPDQHVAWRGDRLPQDCLDLIDRARGGP